MRKIAVITIILLFTINHKILEADELSPRGKIKGTVLDEQSKKPLEYATVALFREDDSLITGSVTDYLGQFKIEQPNAGRYYVSVSFIGFEETRSKIFNLYPDHQTVNIGNILLKKSASMLGEVQVISKSAPIEYKIDKKIINVDKQITSAAGTAVDVLENAPSVEVDIEGNVSLRGSTGFTVLIDGKPTILEPSDALRQIPSSSIENIEIITNPSVKYEPDGATGIINVITKKNYLDGLSGIINLNAGSYDQYGGDFQLSYRADKFNFILGANYRKNTRPGSQENERKTYSKDTIYYVNSNGDAERGHSSTSIRAGVEYNPTKNDYISLSGRIGNWSMKQNAELYYETYTDPGNSYTEYNSDDKTKRGGDYFSIDAVYQHDFKSGGDSLKKSNGISSGNGQISALHNIKLEANYRYRNNDESTINELRTLSDSITSGMKNIEKGPSRNIRINLDYVLPIGESGKFESGIQSRIDRSSDITELYDLNTPGNDYIINDSFSNNTDYSRNVFALYALYAGMTGKFGYQLGLRGEYTYRLISTTGQSDFKIDRWDYFPTLHLSYSLPLEQQLMASYSRRIDRPRGWYLEPFLTWQDEYNVRQGNPGLKPEYIDSYDLGYLKKFNENFFSLEGYYRITNNRIERIRSVYSEDVMLSTFENVGNDYSLGLEAMLNFSLFRWWDINVSGTYYNYKIEGTLESQDFSRTSNNWNSRMSNTFTILKNYQLQINSRYNSESVSAQGTRSGYYTIDAALKLNFMQKRMAANFQVRDILGTSKREYFSEGDDFYSHSIYEPKTPVFLLTLTYRFNNFNPSKSSAQEGESEGGFE